jgi:tagatose 6-phosphate kinase
VILTVTLNPALDVTYVVDSVTPGGTHRVSEVTERAGGKGVNVARVLHGLGVPVLATGLLGGTIGERVGALLAGLPAGFMRIGGETRRTIVATDGQDATGFWEPGPVITPAEWEDFRRHFDLLCSHASVVVCSGSLPPGAPVDAYAQLIAVAGELGVRTVLDTSGAALPAGLAAEPDLIKPNAAELAELSAPIPGRTTVAASNGPDGLTVRGPAGSWRGWAPERLDGNPTGAGDACVAALARGLADRTPWPELLRDAVALSAAAVVAPTAGLVDLPTYQRLIPLINIEELR